LQSINLAGLGWSPFFAEAFAPYAVDGLVPGRVAVQHRGAYVVHTEAGELPAEVTGRLRHEAAGAADLPAVGDWVAARQGDPLLIHAVLPRRTKFSRKAAGAETKEQVVAANVDVVFLVSALAGDLNARRLERYLALGWESGAEPAVVLTKADLCEDVTAALAEIEGIALGVPVHAVSNLTGEGLDELGPYFAGGRTIAVLGSSGVGKSTLINRLAGRDLQAVAEVRADGRGRHTTTRRELVPLPGGGLVLDTPGMRELALWDASGGVEGVFEDVGVLAARCRFPDCAHETEPGCAVRAALEDGSLDAERLASYRKLEGELRHLELKTDKRARSEERKKWRRFARSQRKTVW
jgi:ribosome biogenesis GTPase